MRARVQEHGVSRPAELALALLGAVAVAALLLGALPREIDVLGVTLGKFTLFPLLLGIALWLPLLARRRRASMGDLGLEGNRLVLETRWGRRNLGRVAGVHVAAGKRGASLLFSLPGGRLVAAEVDEPAEARWLAARARAAGAVDLVSVPSAWSGFGAIARVFGTLSALAYWLHVEQRLIPGEKAVYGLGALFTGVALLIFHFVRQRPPVLFDGSTVQLAHGAPPLAPVDARATLGGVAIRLGSGGEAKLPLGDLGPSLRGHLAAHVRAMGNEPPQAMPPPEEPPREELARLRIELGTGTADAYRGASEALRARLEQSARSPSAPLRERALALRVVGGGDAGEVRRRIAESGAPAEDAEFLEEVALAGSDEDAAAMIDRRRPRFVA